MTDYLDQTRIDEMVSAIAIHKAQTQIHVMVVFTASEFSTATEVDFTFATDAIGGDPALSVAPIPFGEPAFVKDTITDTELPVSAYFKTITPTGGVVRVVYSVAQGVVIEPTVMYFTVST